MLEHNAEGQSEIVECAFPLDRVLIVTNILAVPLPPFSISFSVYFGVL